MMEPTGAEQPAPAAVPRGHGLRVSIGFQGGQVLAVRVEDSQLKELYSSLQAGGWHELHCEDGPVRLHLGQVVYVRAEEEESRVGFGA
jgi:hypothetical protein